MKLKNICPIDRYEGPQWLIRPRDDEWREQPNVHTREMMTALEHGGYDIIESDVRGWGQHTHIIREPDYQNDYLATFNP